MLMGDRSNDKYNSVWIYNECKSLNDVIISSDLRVIIDYVR